MICDLTKEDIEQVLFISDKLVGENYLTYEIINNYIWDSQKIIKVYKVDDKIVGFAKGKLFEKNELKNCLLKTDTIIEEELNGKGIIGFLETICVKEEYQRKGIGEELANELINSLRMLKNIDTIYTTVWKSRDGVNSKKLVEKIGFKNITEISDYWYEDSIEKNYICPKCNRPPCKCSMIFYILN